jgi:glycosyltransferase involved in cell wall biosynthesis
MLQGETSAGKLPFDCVVMLTWSDWHTEMRGNRFHYATRFARRCPVYFVQPDGQDMSVRCEKVPNHPQITIVHIPSLDRNILATPLGRFLEERKHRRPLLWCYNYQFASFYCARPNALRVYHASEDYFRWYGPNIPALRHVVEGSDLVLCVSNGVRESLEACLGTLSRAHVVTNGCDYQFYATVQGPHRLVSGVPTPRALYQGYISQKIDFALLLDLTELLPDVSFLFAGATSFDFTGGEKCLCQWQRLLRRPNVHYVGKLPAEELPALVQACGIGLIPFIREDWIVKSGFPLKTFEYLAAGLPVVSTSLDNLVGFHDVIRFASTAAEFADHIRAALACNGPVETERRRVAAYRQDYDHKFADVLRLLDGHLSEARSEAMCDVVTSDFCLAERRRTICLTANEPSQWADGVTRGEAERNCNDDMVIVGIAVDRALDGIEPVWRQTEIGTIFRRSPVPVPWWMYIVCARTVLDHTKRGWALLFSLRLLAMAARRVALGGMRRVIRLIPIPVRRVVKQALVVMGILATEGSRIVTVVTEPSSQSPCDRLVMATQTLVHAVDEIMKEPDIIRCIGAEALLGGVLLKKRFKFRLMYQSAPSQQNGIGALPEQLTAALEHALGKSIDVLVLESRTLPRLIEPSFQPRV